jgi:simple sugar transport system permease protein
MLAALHPHGVVLAAVFIAGMFFGGYSMSRVVTVPTYIADVIVAVSLLAMLVAAQFARYRVRWQR